MKFFEMMLQHSTLIISACLAVLWVLVFRKTARNFYWYMKGTQRYKRIRKFGILRQHGLFMRKHQFYPFDRTLPILTLLVGLALGPIAAWLPSFLDNREWQKAEKERQERAEKERQQQARITEWNKANPPTLYYNTMHGVTAVVRKDAYEEAVRETATARIDGLWELENVLMIIKYTYLFTHKSADEYVPDCWRAGRFSDFEELRKSGTVVLERKNDIFVPLVSDGVLPILEQFKALRSHWSLEYSVNQLRWQMPPRDVLNGTAASSKASA